MVGILRGLDLNDKVKEKINKIKQNCVLTNMIVIYPDNTKFLNVPLYDIKEDSEKVKLDEEKMKDPLYNNKEGSELVNFGDRFIKKLEETLIKTIEKKFENFGNKFQEMKEELILLKKK